MQKNRKYEGSEDEFQKSVAIYLNSKGATWFHPPNGGTRNIIEATKLKAMGVKPGVPDCLIFNKRRGYAGLAIELKVKYNKASEHQIAFIERLKIEGWHCIVSYSLDEVCDTIDWYFG
jgi:hypothetical protein